MIRSESVSSDSKEAGIFLKVTEDFTKYLDKTLETLVVRELRSKGYRINKSVMGRFGFLLVNQDTELLKKYPELLLAAATAESATTQITQEPTP